MNTETLYEVGTLAAVVSLLVIAVWLIVASMKDPYDPNDPSNWGV